MKHIKLVPRTNTVSPLAVAKAVAGLLMASQLASFGQPLALYDNFNGPSGTHSTNWIEIVSPPGTVTYDGSQVILDTTAQQAGKMAGAQAANLSFRLLRTGDRARVTWDQQILTSNPNGWGKGIGLAGPGVFGRTNVGDTISAGQDGQCGGYSDYANRAYLQINHLAITNGNPFPDPMGKHHYDLVLRVNSDMPLSVAAELLVYDYNALFDASPERYTTNGTLKVTLALTNTLTSTDWLTVHLFNENDIPDPWDQRRDSVALDNVFYGTGFSEHSQVLATTAVELYWFQQSNTTAKVQYTTAFPSNWLDLTGTIAGTDSEVSVFDSTRMGQRRFYRLADNPAGVNATKALELHWRSEANASYKVQYSTGLSANWSDLTEQIQGTGDVLSAFDSNRTHPQRFYRVVVSP